MEVEMKKKRDEHLRNEISSRLKKLREARLNKEKQEGGKRINTQDNLAEYIGVTPRTYQKYEADELAHKSNKATPSLETIIKIADCLNCDIDYLVGRQDEYRKATANAAEQLDLNYKSIEKLEKYPSEIKELLNRLILSQTGDNLLKLLKSINNYAVYGHNVFLELYDVSIDSRNTELEDEFEIPVIDKEQSKEVLKRASTGVMRQVLDDAYDNYIPDSNLRLKERLSVRCKKEKEQLLDLSGCSQVSSLSKEERIKLGEWTNWGELSNDEALKKIEQKYQSRYKMYVETVPKKKKEK